MKHLQRFAFLISFLLLASFINAQQVNLSAPIPVDKNVKVGKLKNGITYYIRQNKKPEKRAYLRLVVNAGSILEDSAQQGLAHFVEHMSFNGTKNYKKHEIIDYLESIGMKFGPEINAYTGFDETVYMIEVPTDTAKVVEKGVQILKEWAHNVSFEDDEIDKERGVIVEEWRLGRGAYARIRDKQFPILFKNSKYAVRLPIGKKNIIENFKHSTLRKFYHDWYRPDLMAVVAVGDFDPKWMENVIKKYFSKIPSPKNERDRKIFSVPGNNKTLFAIATDPEMPYTSIGVYYKLPVEEEKTLKDYRHYLIENLYNSMLNERLNEIALKPDPPFLMAASAKGRFVRSKDVYYIGGMVKNGGAERGLEAMLTEAERVKQFGFTQTELNREKEKMVRNYEQAYNERNKTESSKIINEYVNNYLNYEPIPGIAYEYEMVKKLLPGITLNEVDSLAPHYITGKNRVIMLGAPEKKGVTIPTADELKEVIKKVENEKLTAYVDKVSNLPLVDKVPSGSKIVKETKNIDMNFTEWTLANGVRVILKPTNFKNDEILFHAFSPGGNSLVPDKDFIPAETASALVQLSGVGKFDLVALQKLLAGKVVKVYPYVGELSEGINGSASPKDIKTMFQLIYLYFTSPKIDSSAYKVYKTRIKSFLANKNLSPESAFQDTITVTLSQYNLRRKPWSEDVINNLNLEKSLQIYKNRFADASGFTFILVGNFDEEKIKPLVETYLGSLPSINRNENWKNPEINPPAGVISKEVKKGIEPKSMVSLTFTGSYKWGYQNNYNLESMRNVLDIKLRENIRENKGGTYGVWINATGQKYPDQEYNISIMFGCSPKRVNELVDAVFQTIDSLKNIPVADIYITKVKEIQRRQREVNLKENNFWLNTLYRYSFYNMDFSQFNKEENRIDNLSKEAVMKTAKKYFNMKNYVKVVLYPEKS